jgi:hypothetical protein
MVAVETNILNFETIKKMYPNEWILISKIAFLLLVVFMSCKNEQKTPQQQQVSMTDTIIGIDSTSIVKPIENKIIRNYTIVPKKQFGDITSATTEEGLKKIYGDSNVVRINRGSVQTVIFPNTDSEIEIAWNTGQKFKKIESLFIRKGKWQTPEGIHIGSTLKDLEAANGKPVKLVPIDDEEMRPIWQDGKVNPQLVLSYDSFKDKVYGIQINF